MLDRFDFFVLHSHPLDKDNVAQEANLILVKKSLHQIGKKTIFLQDIQDLSNRINVGLAKVLHVYQDVIQIHNYEDIKLFR